MASGTHGSCRYDIASLFEKCVMSRDKILLLIKKIDETAFVCTRIANKHTFESARLQRL